MSIPIGAILVALLLVVILVWALRTLGPQAGLPPPVITVLIVIIGLAFVLWLINALGVTNLHMNVDDDLSFLLPGETPRRRFA